VDARATAVQVIVRPWDDHHVPDEAGYLFDNQQAHAGQRFDALSALFDASTFRHLSAVGLAAGWQVWEVGAGGPTVPTWLADQVTPDGHVLATDIDIAWLEGAERFDVRRSDVGTEPPPPGPFDLVHARLLLVHVPERDAALAAMVSVVRPGGWLVIEEADPALQPLVCLEERSPAERLANRLKAGFRTLLAERGVDLAYGRSMPRRLRAAGLVDVAADAYFPIGGRLNAELERATTAQIRQRLVEAGLATFDEIEEHLVNVAEGRLDLTTSPMVSAWGRRPGSASRY
jgi:SAM-dependent methyltransferase